MITELVVGSLKYGAIKHHVHVKYSEQWAMTDVTFCCLHYSVPY